MAAGSDQPIRLLDAGNDPKVAAAVEADRDVDGEYAFESLRPRQRPLPLRSRGLAG